MKAAVRRRKKDTRMEMEMGKARKAGEAKE